MDKRINGEREKLFKSLYDEYFNLIFIICMKYTNQNKDEAHDLVQNTFMKAYMHIEDVRDKLAYKSWLITIAVNEGKNYLKSKIRGRSLIERFLNFSNFISINSYNNDIIEEQEHEMIETIHTQIKKIEDFNTRRVIEMFYIEEKKIKEISKTLNMNISTITTKLNRFRAKLSKDLLLGLLNNKGKLN